MKKILTVIAISFVLVGCAGGNPFIRRASPPSAFATPGVLGPQLLLAPVGDPAFAASLAPFGGLTPLTDGGPCVKGHNESFVNHTNDYLEIQSTLILPCGTSEVISVTVVPLNGQPRPALVIPPEGYGWYSMPRNGIQPYRVVAYDPSNLVATGGVYRNQLRMPLEGGDWTTIRIFPRDVRPEG